MRFLCKLGKYMVYVALALLAIGALCGFDSPWLDPARLEQIRKTGVVLFTIGGVLLLISPRHQLWKNFSYLQRGRRIY